MQLLPTNKWHILVYIEAVLIFIFWLIVLIPIYRLSKALFFFFLIAFAGLFIYLWVLLYKAKKKVPTHKRYIYHLVSNKKLETIKTSDFDCHKNKGIVHIRKTPKGISMNYSTCGKSVTYFHTSLKGYSYWFNHLLKSRLPDYLLIIPYKELDENLIYTRKIDHTILYGNDYIGPAKVINTDKLRFLKHVRKNDLKLWCLDTFFVMSIVAIIVQLFLVLLTITTI